MTKYIIDQHCKSDLSRLNCIEKHKYEKCSEVYSGTQETIKSDDWVGGGV